MTKGVDLARRGTRIAALSVLVAVAVGVAVIVVALPASREVAIVLTPDDPAVVALGERIYEAQCAVCHGDNLEGQPDWRERLPNGRLPAPPHDETGHTWHHPDEVLFVLTRDGLQALGIADYETDMPAYAGVLTDNEIIAVLSFIKSTWPDQIQRRHDALNAAQH